VRKKEIDSCSLKGTEPRLSAPARPAGGVRQGELKELGNPVYPVNPVKKNY